jgi:hypothetical protein
MKKKSQFWLIFICLFTLHAHVFSVDVEVRYLQPPNLEMSHFGKRVLCHRPIRYGTPKLGVEWLGNKLVAHNYGHG